MCFQKKTQKYWHDNDVFKMLCDFVASDNFVCLTGSGISRGLKLKNNKATPDWNELLVNLKNSIEESSNNTEELKNLNELLKPKGAPGENLIEAASILHRLNKKDFLDALVASVDLCENETSETHKKIQALHPKGILTYNYDVAHENAIGKDNNWEIILPNSNEKIINILKNKLNKQFLFKMHGSVDEKTSMVLTRESYRDLFVKYPFYKAFIQQIFTNYHLMIVGFRMSDPDFEMLLQNVFSTFGSPIQEHIVIKHISEKNDKDIVYKLRYGLHFLYINNFPDIPEILSDCIHTPGPNLNKLLQDCLSSDLQTRGKAHCEVRDLSIAGKNCLAHVLEHKIKDNVYKENADNYKLNTETSELVYTYGVIASVTKQKCYKDFIINEVIEKSNYSEPIAHALVHLRDILDKEDISKVKMWMERFKNPTFIQDQENPDPDNRVYNYCKSIYYLLNAKYGD